MRWEENTRLISVAKNEVNTKETKLQECEGKTPHQPEYLVWLKWIKKWNDNMLTRISTHFQRASEVLMTAIQKTESYVTEEI